LITLGAIPSFTADLVNTVSSAIVVLFAAVVLILGTLVVLRIVLARREEAMSDRKEEVRPLVLDLITSDGSFEDAAFKLAHFVSPKEKSALEQVLLETARVVKGPEKEMLSFIFESMGYVDEDIENIKKGSYVKKATSAFHLGVMGSDRAVPSLLQALSNEDEAVVFAALDSLSHIGTPEAINGVMAFVSRSQGGLKTSRVAEVILDRKKAFAPLMRERLTEGETRYDLRILFIDLLGAAHDGESVTLMKGFLQDAADSDTRSRAARALGSIGDESAGDALVEALGDTSADVRAEAAEALGKIVFDPAVGPLTDALGDSELTVKVSVAFALGKLGDSGQKALEQKLGSAESTERGVVQEVLSTAALRKKAAVEVDTR
jgi:HEAT repeat protein